MDPQQCPSPEEMIHHLSRLLKIQVAMYTSPALPPNNATEYDMIILDMVARIYQPSGDKGLFMLIPMLSIEHVTLKKQLACR